MSKRARSTTTTTTVRAPRKRARVELAPVECIINWTAGLEDMFGVHLIRPRLLTQKGKLQKGLWNLTLVNKAFRQAFFASLSLFDEYLVALRNTLEKWKLPDKFTWPWPNGYTTGPKPDSYYRDPFPTTIHRTFLMAWLHLRFSAPCSEAIQATLEEKLGNVYNEWPPSVLLGKKHPRDVYSELEYSLGTLKQHSIPYTVCRLSQISMRCAAYSLQAMAASLDPATEVPILLMFMSLTNLQGKLVDSTMRFEMMAAFMEHYYPLKAGPGSVMDSCGDFVSVEYDGKWRRCVDVFKIVFDQRVESK